MAALTWPEPLPVWGPVRLRPFRDSDLPLVAELAADPYVPLIGTLPAVVTEESGLAYLHRQHQRLADGQGWSFAVARLADDRAVGGAGLWPHPLGRATAGYLLAPWARGRGLATAALRALTDFAWTRPDVFRVELLIEPWNTASVRVAERAGFVREALLPQHLEIGGRGRDMLRFGIGRP